MISARGRLKPPPKVGRTIWPGFPPVKARAALQTVEKIGKTAAFPTRVTQSRKSANG